MTGIDMTCQLLFSNIQHRCDRLLAHTSYQALRYGRATILWMIRKLDSRRYMPCLPFVSEKRPEEDDFTTASMLYNCMGSFNLDDSRNLSWSQYFSILAATIIEQGQDFKYVLQHHSRNSVPDLIGDTMNCYIIEAMEAVTIAELFANDPCRSCCENQLFSSRVYSMKNARKSIEDFRIQNELESDLIRFWIRGNFTNRTEAARNYYENIQNGESGRGEVKTVRKMTSIISDYENTFNRILSNTINRIPE